MRIEVLSYDAHTRQRKAEPALKQDKNKDADERWSAARNALLKRLGIQWAIDATEYGEGDFFVGEDWSGNSVLHVVVMKWKVLTADFLLECHRFLVPPHDGFLVTVVKSMPDVDDMFELVVTKRRAYVSFFRKEAEAARATINARARFGAIRALLR